MLSFLPPLQPRRQQGTLDRTAVLASTHNSRTALLGAQVPRAQLPEAVRREVLGSAFTLHRWHHGGGCGCHDHVPLEGCGLRGWITESAPHIEREGV